MQLGSFGAQALPFESPPLPPLPSMRWSLWPPQAASTRTHEIAMFRMGRCYRQRQPGPM
jgi:hypothetical protein